MGFIANYLEYELRIAKNDQFRKVFMVVTCVNVLLGHFPFCFWLLLGHFSILNKLAKLNINLLGCWINRLERRRVYYIVNKGFFFF